MMRGGLAERCPSAWRLNDTCNLALPELRSEDCLTRLGTMLWPMRTAVSTRTRRLDLRGGGSCERGVRVSASGFWAELSGWGRGE
eukprot:5580958-Prymnesium_polylepis.1